MKTRALDWETAWKLEDYLMDLFKKKQTHTSEFRILLEVFGKKKIQQVWDQYQKNVANRGKKV